MDSEKQVKTQTIQLEMGDRSYPIDVGENLIEQRLEDLQVNRGFILADQVLTPQALALKKALESRGWQMGLHIAEATEAFKDFQAIYPIYGEMLASGLNRQSTLFALGGGVIGDAGGFLAATYMRGIDWIGIPSTLLAQVDSSVGGKTGVNHDKGKNLIGAFHQPKAVWCDTQLLHTLPVREMISGLGEMLKYGLIFDPDYYHYLAKNWDRLKSCDEHQLVPAIARSIAFKAETVSQDEFDLKGIREVLNFGHTIGHALETITDYQRYKHGEAVLWGMQAATVLSVWQGHLDATSAQDILDFLHRIHLPSLPDVEAADAVVEAIKYDKKSEGQRVRFVLLKGLGQTCSDNTLSKETLKKLMHQALSKGRFEL